MRSFIKLGLVGLVLTAATVAAALKAPTVVSHAAQWALDGAAAVQAAGPFVDNSG